MNRYDYYTRCGCVDEQEWLTEELYYPDGDDCHAASCDDYDDYGYDEPYGYEEDCMEDDDKD